MHADVIMQIFQSSDRAEFLAHRPPGTAIRVVRMPSVQIVLRDGRIEHIAAVELTYSFVKGDGQWVFQELRFPDDNGHVSFGDTLWAELEREGGYRLLQRSGSF